MMWWLVISPQHSTVSLYQGRRCVGARLTDWDQVLDVLGPPTVETEFLAEVAWHVLVVSDANSRFVPAESLY